MKVLVIGAAGKTGTLIVEQAVAAGHDVTAFVRHSGRYAAPSGVHVFVGDATNAALISAAMAGQDAVIDAIAGKTPWRTTTLEQTAARAIVAAAKEQRTQRIIAISAIGVGASKAHAPLPVRYLLLPTFLRGSTADKTAMERLVEQSGIPYVLVRPAVLNDKPATGMTRVLAGTEKGSQISRADVAAFVVGQLTTDTHLNRAVTIATK